MTRFRERYASKDGYDSWCQACHAADKKARRERNKVAEYGDKTMRCSKCQEELPFGKFAKSVIKQGHGYCQACRRDYQKMYREGSLERKMCSVCHEEKPATQFYKGGENLLSWCKACSSKRGVEAARIRKYGLEPGEYNDMLTDQGGACKICGEAAGAGEGKQNQKEDSLCVDHCHETGKVRGLLCNRCNWMLGNAKDDPEILRQGIQYLKAS